MPGPLIGALLLGSGIVMAALTMWLARQGSPRLQEVLPASFWAILWRVAVVVLAVGVFIAVYLRLFGADLPE